MEEHSKRPKRTPNALSEEEVAIYRISYLPIAPDQPSSPLVRTTYGMIKRRFRAAWYPCSITDWPISASLLLCRRMRILFDPISSKIHCSLRYRLALPPTLARRRPDLPRSLTLHP